MLDAGTERARDARKACHGQGGVHACSGVARDEGGRRRVAAAAALLRAANGGRRVAAECEANRHE